MNLATRWSHTAGKRQAEAGNFRDRTGRERRNDLVDEFPAPFRSGVVDGPELLVALPGDRDFVVGVPGSEFGIEPRGLFLAEVFGADLQGPADPVERISFASPVAQGVLLDPAADFVDHGCSKFHDVERVQDGDGLGQ